MKPLPLILAIATASAALGNPSDRQLEGTWKAVKITLTKNATKDQAAEESGLGWFSIELQPNHRAECSPYVTPTRCRWVLNGSTLTLLPETFHSKSPGQETTVKFPPIRLSVSPDGKTLTRVFDGRVFTFAKATK